MKQYCPHLVPLTHSCENCSADKPLFETQIKNLETQLKHKEGINKSLESLVLEQDKTITELSTKLIYANRTIENLTVEEPPKEPQYLYVYNLIDEGKTWMSPTLLQETYGWNYMGKVEVIK